MKPHYAITVPGTFKPAIADLTQVGDRRWELNRINVPQEARGKGYGRELLARVTAEADAEGASLVLYINPYGPLDRDDLVDWYGRNGFTPCPPGSKWEMERTC